MDDKHEEMNEGEQAGRDEASVFPLINEAHVAGRLSNAVAIKDYGEGKKRAQFAIAVPRSSRKTQGGVDVDYFTIVAWGALAEQSATLSKGDGLEIHGRLRTWQDETKRYHWGITAEILQVILRPRRQRANQLSAGERTGELATERVGATA